MVKFWAAILALALIAGACGNDDDSGDGPATSEPTAASEPTAEPGSSGSSGSTGSGGDNVDIGYDEIRGDIFVDFQQTFDRSHPFQPLDAFCRPTPDPDSPPQATDTGITEDTITIVHLRTKLEQLESVGFGVPVGDTRDMFETFANVINEQCNGIWGRQIDMQLVEVSALGGGGEDIDTLRNQACIEATEDRGAVIVTNSTGFQGTAILCIAENDTLFVTTQGNPRDFLEQGDGLIYSLSPVAEDSVRNMARAVIDSGALDGKTIGVVWPDTPGQPEAVQGGLIDVLEAAGYEVAVAEQIGCGGGTICRDGNDIAVEQMLEERVDVVFPALNVLSLPQFISEMISQGFSPGDVQFYNSDFNSQAGDLVSSKVAEFGGDAAGELYNGTVIIDDAPTGYFRVTDDPVISFLAPFNVMCNETYAANNTIGASHELEVYGSYESSYGMTITVCAQMRMVARALYDAGPNPTRQDVYDAFANLGSVDLSSQIPGSFGPDKFGAPDAVTELLFQFPCPNDPDIPTCVEPISPYQRIQE